MPLNALRDAGHGVARADRSVSTASTPSSAPEIAPERTAGILVLSSRADVRERLEQLVTRCGHEPHLPLDDEPAERAASRVRPCIAIVDIDHAAAHSGIVTSRLAALGTRTLLCGAWHQETEARRAAERMGALCFVLPIAHRDFELLLRTVLLL